MAKLAERHVKMVVFMEKVSASTENSEELTIEERNLLSVTYKNVIGACRASRCIISSIEQKEERRGNEDHVSTICDYRSKIETELSSICDEILKASKNPGTVNLRQFAFYAFAGKSGLPRWSGKNENIEALSADASQLIPHMTTS